MSRAKLVADFKFSLLLGSYIFDNVKFVDLSGVWLEICGLLRSSNMSLFLASSGLG